MHVEWQQRLDPDKTHLDEEVTHMSLPSGGWTTIGFCMAIN
jgi:hypothetical protein